MESLQIASNCMKLHQSILIFKTRNTTESKTKETEEEYLGVAGRSTDSQEIMIKTTQLTEVDVVDSKVAWLQYMGYYQAWEMAGYELWVDEI